MNDLKYYEQVARVYADDSKNYKEVKYKMAYVEINPTDWTYTKDGEFIEGIYALKKEDIGINKSKLYSIETSDGVKNVWGSAILDSRMALVKVGDKIKITYKGLGEATGGKNPPKLFKVEVDKKLHPDN